MHIERAGVLRLLLRLPLNSPLTQRHATPGLSSALCMNYHHDLNPGPKLPERYQGALVMLVVGYWYIKC